MQSDEELNNCCCHVPTLKKICPKVIKNKYHKASLLSAFHSLDSYCGSNKCALRVCYIYWVLHIAYNEYSSGYSIVVISEVPTRVGDLSAGCRPWCALIPPELLICFAETEFP